ncbi:MAG: DUF2961 domain-containing protein, partial [Planctomycetaceae bacterium]|nr:DUF2961 domain-containing protein [Planctomycetaceae bacterium]
GGGPAYTPFLVTSRDPASTDPRDPLRWFSENDSGHALRFELVGQRNEWILADAQGPGVITRIVLALEPTLAGGTVRVRIDGAIDPVLEIPIAAAVGASPPFPRPFCEVVGMVRDGSIDSGALTLRVPVPFAARCSVSIDRRPAAYQIEGRTYAAAAGPTAAVASLDLAACATLAGDLARIAPRLTPSTVGAASAEGQPHDLAPGARARLRIDGRGTVERLALAIVGDDFAGAAHELWIEIAVDDTRTVCAPVGGFFGLGESGGNVADRYRAVRVDVRPGGSPMQGSPQNPTQNPTQHIEQRLASHLPIPFASSVECIVSNRGKSPRAIRIDPLRVVDAVPAPFRTLHAAHSWRGPERIIAPEEVELVRVDGQGVLVGTTLTVRNPVAAWWGGGDERISIDGPALTLAGTGVDHWASSGRGLPRALSSAFISVGPRISGTREAYDGFTTVSRWRGLDTVPFSRSLRSTLECLPLSVPAGEFSLGCTSFWYAEPGASRAVGAADPVVVEPLVLPSNLARMPGWVEAEESALVGHSMGSRWEPQDVGFFFPDESWSGGRHVFLRATKPGEWFEFEVPAQGDGRMRLSARFCMAHDYGRIAVRVNGVTAVRELSLFSPSGRPSEVVDLGEHAPADGRFRVRIEVLGAAPESGGQMFTGVDAFRLEPVAGAGAAP